MTKAIEMTSEQNVEHSNRPARMKFTCYHFGCEGVEIEATIGKEVTSEIHPNFIGLGMVGRIRWNPAKSIRCFKIDAPYGDCRCPKCNSIFVKILIASSKTDEEIRFGYEAERI